MRRRTIANSRPLTVVALLSSLLLLGGSAERLLASPGTQGVSLQGVSLQGVSLQGVSLQGVSLQGVSLQGVSLQGVSLQGVSLQGSSMQGYRWNSSGGYWEYRYPTKHRRYINGSWSGYYSGGLAGSYVTGQLSNGNTVQLYIASTKQDGAHNTMPSYSSNSDVWLFKLYYHDGSYWRYLCGGDRYGMFLKGSWDDRGYWSSSGTTFACTNGVLSKCARNFGYKPWKTMRDEDGRYHPMRNFYQSCTRAARADYCRSGESFTMDGTWVDMFDNFGFNKKVSEADTSTGYAFEGLFAEIADDPVPYSHQLRQTRYEEIAEQLSCTPNLNPYQDPDIYFAQKSWSDRDTAYEYGVREIAISTSTYCTHSVSSSGARMLYDCNDCTRTVCDDDDYCCTHYWDSLCVSEANSWCS